MARVDLSIDERGNSRQGDGRLGDVVRRIGLENGGKSFTLGAACVRSDEHAVATGFSDSLYDQLVEIGEHMRKRSFLTGEKSLDTPGDGVFGEVVADDA